MLTAILAWRENFLRVVMVHKVPFNRPMVTALAATPTSNEEALVYYQVAVKHMSVYEATAVTISEAQVLLSAQPARTSREIAVELYSLVVDGGVLRVVLMGEGEVTQGEPLVGYHMAGKIGTCFPLYWENTSDLVARLSMRKDAAGGLTLSSANRQPWGTIEELWIRTALGNVTRMGYDVALSRHVEVVGPNSTAIWNEGVAAAGGLFAFTIHTTEPASLAVANDEDVDEDDE